MIYEVGKTYKEFMGKPEECHFDIDDSGAVFWVTYNCPTPEEIKQFSSNHAFEARYASIYDIIMLQFKFGTLNWMDVPYTPHSSQNLTWLPEVTAGKGLGILVILADTANGEVKVLRYLSFSEKFSRELLKEVKYIQEKEFDRNVFNKNLNTIYSRYTTRDLLKISRSYCKLSDAN